jgi:hypothetical protein
MRTGLFLVAGFLLLGASLLLGRLFSTSYPAATAVAVAAYALLWLAIALFNMWLGMARAGYSMAEELPIFALIFVVPVAVALVLKWRLL